MISSLKFIGQNECYIQVNRQSIVVTKNIEEGEMFY